MVFMALLFRRLTSSNSINFFNELYVDFKIAIINTTNTTNTTIHSLKQKLHISIFVLLANKANKSFFFLFIRVLRVFDLFLSIDLFLSRIMAKTPNTPNTPKTPKTLKVQINKKFVGRQMGKFFIHFLVHFLPSKIFGQIF